MRLFCSEVFGRFSLHELVSYQFLNWCFVNLFTARPFKAFCFDMINRRSCLFFTFTLNIIVFQEYFVCNYILGLKTRKSALHVNLVVIFSRKTHSVGVGNWPRLSNRNRVRILAHPYLALLKNKSSQQNWADRKNILYRALPALVRKHADVMSEIWSVLRRKPTLYRRILLNSCMEIFYKFSINCMKPQIVFFNRRQQIVFAK
jgi:hypothetical protein